MADYFVNIFISKIIFIIYFRSTFYRMMTTIALLARTKLSISCRTIFHLICTLSNSLFTDSCLTISQCGIFYQLLMCPAVRLVWLAVRLIWLAVLLVCRLNILFTDQLCRTFSNPNLWILKGRRCVPSDPR